MKIPVPHALTFAGLLALTGIPHSRASVAPTSADVVIYGGSAAGVVAGVEVARLGRSVIVIEPGRHLGGLTSGGLSMTDTGVKATIGGVAREFYERVYRYYQAPEVWRQTTRKEYLDWLPTHWAGGPKDREFDRIQYVFEPHVAGKIMDEMVRESGVQVIIGERLDLKAGVQKNGAAITGIRMESGRIFTARVFIDATYEGDLMAKAGVSYVTGREGNSKYGETLNGILPSGPAVFEKISPYVTPGDPRSGLLPRVDPRPPGRPGDGDHRQQAYNFRVCLTNAPDNRVPLQKPANYNPLDYELLARWIATMKNVRPEPSRIGDTALGGGDRNIGISFHKMPNRKTDSNIGSEFGSDYLGRSYDWAEGDHGQREALWQEHKTYVQGLLWFLAHDERCPPQVRAEMRQWGLAKDEFADTDHWPFQLYVREARRMVSDYVVTEHDARGVRAAEDPVALGSYHSDSHGVCLYVDEQGRLCREKGFYVRTGVFGISYRSIRPRAAECTNLLVPMCLSASHAAYGPTRMEPVFMMLGQAAGAAAALAIEAGTTVQALPYPRLRDRLRADRAILEWKPSFPAAAGKKT
jgi:hypothetical protein